MLFKALLFLIFVLSLFGDNSLKSNYYIKSDEIKLSDIVSHTNEDEKLFTIMQGKYTKRVKSSKVLEQLRKYGYQNYTAKHSYIKFTKISPIDTSKIEKEIEKIYKSKYKNIKINTIEVRPRGYLEALPDNYVVSLAPKKHLKSSGIVSIRSKSKKQLFFDYHVDAVVQIYETREKLKRNTELSHRNCRKKSIILNKFRALPIQELVKGRLQSKNHLKANAILTSRDVRELVLVKRGSIINMTLNNNNIDISFSGEALEDATFGEVIKVKQNNEKILKVRITAKGRGEVI